MLHALHDEGNRAGRGDHVEAELGQLEEEQKFPRTKIMGLRADVAPASWLELGFGRTFMFGGDGRPEPPWYQWPALLAVSSDRTTSNFSGNNLFQVDATVEKPPAREAPSRMAIIGRYILRPEIFSILSNLPPGRGGEIQLTDGLAQLVKERKVFGCEFEGNRYDIGDKFGFVRATVAYALKRTDLKDKVLEYLKATVS